MAKQDPWIFRLWQEYELLEHYCSNSEEIAFEGISSHPNLPPETYIVNYNLPGITGISPDQEPIFSYTHKIKITLPPTYPILSGPVCRAISDIWHPNIRSDGPHKGRICLNNAAMGFWFTLDLLADQVKDMISYKKYHALLIQPYPEDLKVAEWVRTYAEPKGIIDPEKGIIAHCNLPEEKSNSVK